MNHRGFIGSFAISALLVSAAVALLVVTGAMLAFDGFPGPSLDDSAKGVRAVNVVTGSRPKPELVLDPPSAGALIPGADASVAAETAPGALVATPGAAGAPAAPALAPTDTAVAPAPPPPPQTVSTVPELPGAGAGDEPTEAIESEIDGLPPVTDGVDDLVDGVNGSVERP